MSSCDIFSVICGGDGPVLPGAFGTPEGPRLAPVTLLDNRANTKTPCQWYQDALIDSTADILIYAHDDIEVYDANWLQRVLNLFENQNCAVVGLGGAPQLGHESLYKKPYAINQLARQGYVSNQTDYDIHGGRLEGDMRVVVCDAFFLAVRRQFLRDIGGWPTAHLTHHCLDLWLACEAARHQQETWIAGVRCLHKGGGSSTKPTYMQAKWLQRGNLIGDHQAPHEFLYREFRDVLPIIVR